MSNQKDLVNLIKSLTGQANVLTVPRDFIDYMESLDGALFLSQVIYWSDKGKDGWFYKTYAEWKDEICLGRYEVERAVKTLKAKGFLETDIRKAAGAPTVHYRFRFVEFSESFCQFLAERNARNSQIESLEISTSSYIDYTETTAKTTTPPSHKNGDGDSGGALPPKEATRSNTYLPDAQRQIDMLIPQAARIDDDHTEALTAVERSTWRIGGDTKDALIEFMVATHLGIPRPKKDRDDWADALTYHVQTFGATQLRKLYPATVKYMRDRDLIYTRPSSLTTCMSKVAAELQEKPKHPEWEWIPSVKF